MADLNINDETFEVFPLTGRQGLVWPYRLAKYMRGFFAGSGGTADFERAFSSFFSECSESEYISFAEGMFETVHFSGKSMKVLYTTKFAGNLTAMYKLLFAVCKFHFEDFFYELQNFGSLKTPEGTSPKVVKIRD